MDVFQRLRTIRRSARESLAGMRARSAMARAARAKAAFAASDVELRAQGVRRRKRLRPGFALFLAAVAAAILSYSVAAWWNAELDDDLSFAPPQKGASHAVAAIAALIGREVNTNGWTPNDPFFFPTALLTAKPNFQRGIVFALAGLTEAIADTPDMREAATELHYPPDSWMWNPAVSLRLDNSEAEYRRAIAALERANAEGAPAPDPQRLSALLAMVRAQLDQSARTIGAAIRARGHFPFSHSGAALFYVAKGSLYADAMVLKAAQQDFAAPLHARGLDMEWNAMMRDLAAGIALEPALAMNGAPDSLLVPCHLCAEGFFIARAQDTMTRLAEKIR